VTNAQHVGRCHSLIGGVPNEGVVSNAISLKHFPQPADLDVHLGESAQVVARPVSIRIVVSVVVLGECWWLGPNGCMTMVVRTQRMYDHGG
jgi:hypothetical protein